LLFDLKITKKRSYYKNLTLAVALAITHTPLFLTGNREHFVFVEEILFDKKD